MMMDILQFHNITVPHVETFAVNVSEFSHSFQRNSFTQNKWQHRLHIDSPFEEGEVPPFLVVDNPQDSPFEVPIIPVELPGPVSIKHNIRNRFPVTNHNSRLNVTASHIPVLWAALSIAMGQNLRGDLVRGLPCITRFNQLFCRNGGNSYPSDRIETFIDDNKALIRRMYGEFISVSSFSKSNFGRSKRSLDNSTDMDNFEGTFSQIDDLNNVIPITLDPHDGKPYVNIFRKKRQASPGPLPKSDRVDSCHSDEEVATPYWASNSRGKILAIVNTNEFSQIIHQEICTKKSTKRCNGDCGCEQKYKYHRLMAYDPDNNCKGIYMDWFLFPSCCSCRCDP